MDVRSGAWAPRGKDALAEAQGRGFGTCGNRSVWHLLNTFHRDWAGDVPGRVDSGHQHPRRQAGESPEGCLTCGLGPRGQQPRSRLSLAGPDRVRGPGTPQALGNRSLGDRELFSLRSPPSEPRSWAPCSWAPTARTGADAPRERAPSSHAPHGHDAPVLRASSLWRARSRDTATREPQLTALGPAREALPTPATPRQADSAQGVTFRLTEFKAPTDKPACRPPPYTCNQPTPTTEAAPEPELRWHAAAKRDPSGRIKHRTKYLTLSKRCLLKPVMSQIRCSRHSSEKHHGSSAGESSRAHAGGQVAAHARCPGCPRKWERRSGHAAGRPAPSSQRHARPSRRGGFNLTRLSPGRANEPHGRSCSGAPSTVQEHRPTSAPS